MAMQLIKAFTDCKWRAQLCIPQPTRHLIHRLAELGRLYRRISTFAKEREQAQEVGLIMQVRAVQGWSMYAHTLTDFRVYHSACPEPVSFYLKRAHGLLQAHCDPRSTADKDRSEGTSG